MSDNGNKKVCLLDVWKVVVENKTSLQNHLHDHEMWFKCVFAPLGVVAVLNLFAVGALLVKSFFF